MIRVRRRGGKKQNQKPPVYSDADSLVQSYLESDGVPGSRVQAVVQARLGPRQVPLYGNYDIVSYHVARKIAAPCHKLQLRAAPQHAV